MVVYMGGAGYSMYKLMYPLASVDLSSVPPSDFVNPLWDEGTSMDMRVYVSKRPQFALDFIHAEFPPKSDKNENEMREADDDSDNETKAQTSNQKNKKKEPPADVALLWSQELLAPSLSKSFLITSLNTEDESSCQADASFLEAKRWLDQAEETAVERGEGGVLSTINSAGQGIESTSFLLTGYYALSRQIRILLAFLSLGPPVEDADDSALLEGLKLERTTINLPPTSPLWGALKSNSTFYLHVMVVRQYKNSRWEDGWPPQNLADATTVIRQASQSHALLFGQVNMVKFEVPHHISKPKRILYHDLSYLLRRYVMQSVDTAVEMPPWDFSYSKPEDQEIYESYLKMKERGAGYPYWKPEVSIKYVKDDESYPKEMTDYCGMQMVRLPKKTPDHPTGIAHIPSLYSSEIGLTSDKFIPINETVTTLPLRVSFDRSDVQEDTQHQQSKVTTATAGGISPARWRLLSHLTQVLEAQKSLGFEDSDIDEVKLLIADTDITLLTITMLASALHLLFEFLTFKSEVNFWRENKDLTGLSVRALFLDVFGQTVILLYLIERESSLLMVGPSAVGCLIAFWKCRRASGLKFVKTDQDNLSTSWWNGIFRLVGFELRATRLETKKSSGGKDDVSQEASNRQEMTALTLESDRLATRTLGVFMGPVILGYIIYSLLEVEHSGWYSWMVTSASSAVYALGFVLMTPQLFLNWKLKSVAHLPWQVLIYKSLNTFIDDLFSFIVRMPTMARISCFRDDIVFFIYLYQRWLYPVDTSRPVEGGGGPIEEKADVNKTEKKKNQ